MIRILGCNFQVLLHCHEATQESTRPQWYPYSWYLRHLRTRQWHGKSSWCDGAHVNPGQPAVQIVFVTFLGSSPAFGGGAAAGW